MARPTKEGLDYFPLECHFKDSIKFVIAKHGPEGFGILVLLWRKIYQDRGYYTEWTEKNLVLFASEHGINVDIVSNVLKTCLNEGFFDARILKDRQILTGKGIQERYLKIITDSKRRRAIVSPELNLVQPGLLPEKPQVITGETPPGEEFTPEETPQSKGKESKGKESKENKNYFGGDAPPDPVRDIYNGLSEAQRADKNVLVNLIRKHAPTFIDPYVDTWRIFARETKLPSVRDITESRRRKFAARIKEKPFNFLEILKKAKSSPFCLNGSWFTFDWILENDKNYLKVLEGNYVQAPGAGRTGPVAPSLPKTREQLETEELNFLIARSQDPDFTPEYIRPEFYDILVARKLIEFNTLHTYPGETFDDKKRNGVVALLRTLTTKQPSHV